MPTIIHAADFHLDSPFDALPPALAMERREEQRELLHRLALTAEELRADLILLSGDLFDGSDAYLETAQTLLRALSNIRANIFIAPGNHDYWSSRSPYAALSWPDNVHIFHTAGIESVPIPECGCVVHGAAFTSPFRDDCPLKGFHAPEDGNVHIMVLHGDMGKHSRYCPIDPVDVAASGLHYLALGHVHARSPVGHEGPTAWAYPGCPEGRGFDELGEKGILAGTILTSGVNLRFIPLCKRRYEILTIPLSGNNPPEDQLLAALPRDAVQDIYRLLLTGESGAEGLDLPALHTAAAPFFYSVALYDQTRIRRDLWARADEDTLTGLFLQQLRTRWESALDADRTIIEDAVRFGLAALENGEDYRP
ncbi:MAG: double-strand break repair protein Mre11 [Oscillospiraceae bacterium]|nr:double-strand break repair protein Mre11 [Oscillospiraceae bacterium]